jgi:N-acetylmuramoyl-L-alanine amidase
MTEQEIKDAVKKNLDEAFITNNELKAVTTSIAGMSICIDPGHGGTEPGAIATYNGVTYYEKNLNLTIAFALESYLMGKGMTVVMTRRSDTTTSLTGRVAMANFNDVDVFVSTHCNSSTYTVKAGTTCIWPNNHDISSSIDLAFSVNNQVYADTPFGYYQPYEDTRNLAVLRGTYMPAIITETGYMSNGSDMSYLSSTTNLQTIGRAIGKGVEFYLD